MLPHISTLVRDFTNLHTAFASTGINILVLSALFNLSTLRNTVSYTSQDLQLSLLKISVYAEMGLLFKVTLLHIGDGNDPVDLF